MNNAMTDAAIEKALQLFYEEAGEAVADMEQILLALENEPTDHELLNALFRGAHTIKGSAGMFGLDQLVRFSHEVETVLESLRSRKRTLNASLSSLLLNCVDQIAQLLQFARDCPSEALPDDIQADSIRLSAALLLETAEHVASPLAVLVPVGNAAVSVATQPMVWHISVRFAPDSFFRGVDPLATLRYLSSLGEIEMVETIDLILPPLSKFDCERCYIGFEIRLLTAVSRRELDDAFEFINDECTIHIIPPGPSLREYIQLIDDLPSEAERIGEILVRCGALSQQQLHQALARQHQLAAEAGAAPPLGELLQQDPGVSPHLVDAALKKQSENRDRKTESKYFRVLAEKLDDMINVVGELVIFAGSARLQAADSCNDRLQETLNHVAYLVDTLRGSAMAMRMVPIGESFERFRRVVRDVSSTLGKSIRLDIEGGETELDKAVVEKIGDPLMHLVRNALDHGIETPNERESAGKSPEGRLLLSARHESGSIVLQIRDDGRGMDPVRILKKAQERGLVTDTAQLSRADIFKLIFEPGISTAEQVSDLSGRGVGMDVVRRNIESLRGSVEIDSEVGVGSTITVRLPLTLAIIDGFMVRCGNNNFVLPLDQIEECIVVGGKNIDGYVGVMMHRDAPLAVINVNRLLDTGEKPTARRSVVVVKSAGKLTGLQVDQLLGEQQTVIKPLGALFANLDFIAGSSVMGSGEIALILDVPALLSGAARADSASRRLLQANLPEMQASTIES